jgi:putative sigma-54 modulation protein
MDFVVKFKSISHSQAVTEYIEERFAKLAKYEMKPVTVHVTLSEEGHERKANVYVQGLQGAFRAEGASDSFYVSIDMCFKKLKRQMEKEKSKVQHHHHYAHSDEAQLEELARLEERERKVA